MRRAVGAAAHERLDNVAVGVGQAACSVVADIGDATRRPGLVADHGLLQPDEEGLRVGRIDLGARERPGGSADHRVEVVGDAGRGCGEAAGEVELERAAVAEDGGRDGSVVVEAVGQAERGLRDGLLAAAGLGPAQMEVGAAVVLEVLDLDVVGGARGQLDGRGRLFTVPVVDPVVDGELSVHPEAEAVVADDREGVGAGPLRHDLSGPADADVVRTAGGEGQTRLQVVEVECGVEGGRLELVEVEGAGGGLGVVLALQAMDLHGVVGGGGGGCRGQARQAEGADEKQHESVSEAFCAHGASITTLSWTVVGITTRIPSPVQVHDKSGSPIRSINWRHQKLN